MTPQKKLENLIIRLAELGAQHRNMSTEIIRIREEVALLKKQMGMSGQEPKTKELSIDEVPIATIKEEEVPEVEIDFSRRATPPPLPGRTTSPRPKERAVKPKKAFDLEAFIGGNLINKIGILILIIGLGLLVKYAIDNGYFPPMIRLILSFLAGLTLVGIGYRLKEKYKSYSAVLFSGGMAVLYFSAYGGNAFYDPVLLPRATAFILMVIFTVVTVSAAMMYNLEIIALLGLVGAYAVPILLSDGSGDYKLLFSYMAIINTGVLLVTIRRNWRITLYVAFGLTWMIFAYWTLIEYDSKIDTNTAWIFNLLFFGIFYAALLTYNLLNDKKFTIDSVLFITINAFIFYGLGMWILSETGMENYYGLFTLGNGLMHLAVAGGIYKQMADKKLFFVISGLFWLFLTLAIGVEFGGAVRPLLWIGEAVILFGIGRRFNIGLYEIASFIVLFFGLSMIMEFWGEGYYDSGIHQTVLANRYFLTSVLTMVGLGVMYWMNQKWETKSAMAPAAKVVLPALLITVLYASFFNEIYHQFEQAYYNSEIREVFDSSIWDFSAVWLINYSFVFLIGLLAFNYFYLKNKFLGNVIGFLSLLIMGVFLTGGILSLNSLRTAYLEPELSPLFSETSYWIWIRYISYVFAVVVLFCISKTMHWYDNVKNVKAFFQLFVYTFVLVVLSNELTTFMRLGVGVETSSLTHRVGFSILWAVYSLIMILVGFKQQSKLLRVAGIVLFGITLVKVFFVDLVDISTESRILLFVAIGVLLLVTSFLYQKFAHVLLGDAEKEMDEEEQLEED